MRPEDILLPTPAGVCCKNGGFHIDPTRPVVEFYKRRDEIELWVPVPD